MKATATQDFNTSLRRYRVGDEVLLADVGEALFYLCTDAKKEEPKPPKAKPPPEEN